MRFTEQELTVAVQTAARLAFASSRGRGARKDPESAWQSLTPQQRYQLLEPVSGQLLPVLAALPEVEVAAGAAPSFTLAQITAAVEQSMGAGGGRFRRKIAVAGRAALVKSALDALPAREDPDDLRVPDHP